MASEWNPLDARDTQAPAMRAAQSARRRRERRLRGVFYLGTSIWLLVSGLTWLEGRLRGLGFVLYWTLCAGAAVLAWMVALNDAVRTPREIRWEERERSQ